MKNLLVPFLCLFCVSISLVAQVGINNTSPKALLDISSTSLTSPEITDGILIPKMNNFPLTNPSVLQDGMMIYATGDGAPSKGFYYWDNATSEWVSVGANKINDLSDGKSDSNGSSVFLGIGAGASDVSTTNRNIGIGQNSLSSNTVGTNNTAVGYSTLVNNVSGNSNTAIGSESLLANKGDYNTATGSQTLKTNTFGKYNTAIGYSALSSNTTGEFNTAVGYFSLSKNTGGKYNTAIGNGALYSFTSGEKNIAIVTDALNLKISGDNNVANGSQSLNNNIFGSNNVAIGYQAGFFETGSNKLYIESSNGDGNSALIYGDFQTNFLRFNADVEVNTGSLNVDGGTFFVDDINNRVGIGTSSPTTKLQIVGGTDAQLTNNTGYFVIGPESGENIVMDDNEIMARNNGATSPLYLQNDGGDVFVGGTVVHTSDRRLKKDITHLSYGLKEILQLEPKSYFWKNREQKYKSIGLIAQDVQPIIKELVHTSDDKEKSLSISYIELIPILINAMKEQETKIQELEKQLSQNSALEARLEKLEALLIPNALVKD